MRVHYISPCGRKELRAAVTSAGAGILSVRVDDITVELLRCIPPMVLINCNSILIRQENRCFHLTMSGYLIARIDGYEWISMYVPDHILPILIELLNVYKSE